ncbi:hypothetical protein D3C85_1074500 [compost metagenome]
MSGNQWPQSLRLGAGLCWWIVTRKQGRNEVIACTALLRPKTKPALDGFADVVAHAAQHGGHHDASSRGGEPPDVLNDDDDRLYRLDLTQARVHHVEHGGKVLD